MGKGIHQARGARRMTPRAVVFVMGVGVVAVWLGGAPWAGAQQRGGKVEPVRLDLYVMSQCPFGTQAENAVFPAVKSLGSLVEFRLNFIANEAPAQPGPDGKPGKPAFQSLHGQGEVDENIRHLCAMKQYPKLYLDFITERNANIRSPDWQSAAKKVGLDPAKLEACATGEEGAKLLSDSIKVSQQRQARSSPTIDVNGAPYTGARGVRSFTLALCDALAAKGVPLPEACEKAKALPPDPMPGGGGAGCGPPAGGFAAGGGCGAAGGGGGCGPAAGRVAGAAGVAGRGAGQPVAPPAVFDVQVLVSEECTFCDPTLTKAIKDRHAGARIKPVQANTDEGKALIKRFNVRALPFYILSKDIEKEPNFFSLTGYYTKSGEAYLIRPGSGTYTPVIQLDRKRVPHHLDLFVESLSPFSVQVEADLIRLLEQTDAKELTFSIHYLVQETVKGEETASSRAQSPSTDVRAAPLKEIKTVTAGPLTTRRGEAELQESMRQVCLFQHTSIGTFFTYLSCRNQNILDAARGETCLELTEPIRKCLEGPEGERFLRQDARLVRELGLTAGPVILWENRYGPFGWHEVDWSSVIADTK